MIRFILSVFSILFGLILSGYIFYEKINHGIPWVTPKPSHDKPFPWDLLLLGVATISWGVLDLIIFGCRRGKGRNQ